MYIVWPDELGHIEIFKRHVSRMVISKKLMSEKDRLRAENSRRRVCSLCNEVEPVPTI